MKSKNLLTQLADLEEALNNFSFEELSARDAGRLKKSFDVFKDQLEQRFFGNTSVKDTEQHNTSAQQLDTDPVRREESLIATVSHEIRTPLSGIVGFTDLLQETELSALQSEQVSAIRKASINLMGIINELLEYSKLSAGLENFKRVNFNFDGILQDVAYLCQTLIQDKAITLSVDRDPQIPEYLVGDPAKLSQVLLNLLGNSVKFVDKGQIQMNISLIRQRADRLLLEFVISDTGIGISENDLNTIFDSFKQADQQTFSKYGGTGLGLHIVKQIVQKLNGQLEVSSQLGVGTTFRFTLEYEKGKKTKTPSRAVSDISADEVRGMKILVFEDNLLNQRLIEQRLKYWGCQCYITENPHYGLELIENKPIDLVLMDLRMPLMDGFEVTKRIRGSKQQRVSEVPVIALTADFTIEDRNACEAGGINDYLLKPYKPEELLNKIVRNKDGKSGQNLNTEDPVRHLTNGIGPELLVDLKSAMDDCMGDRAVLQELVRLFKGNMLEFMGRMKIHLANGDFQQIRDASHKVKCGLAMMHVHSLHYIVEQIHNSSRNTRDINQLDKLFESFVAAYPMVEKAIDEAMENIQ